MTNKLTDNEQRILHTFLDELNMAFQTSARELNIGPIVQNLSANFLIVLVEHNIKYVEHLKLRNMVSIKSVFIKVYTRDEKNLFFSFSFKCSVYFAIECSSSSVQI